MPHPSLGKRVSFAIGLGLALAAMHGAFADEFCADLDANKARVAYEEARTEHILKCFDVDAFKALADGEIVKASLAGRTGFCETREHGRKCPYRIRIGKAGYPEAKGCQKDLATAAASLRAALEAGHCHRAGSFPAEGRS